MEYVLSTENLCKQYSKHLVVDNVSLHIKRGEIYGFIGRNGAGKTTFMKMACGLAMPTSGTIELFGVRENDINMHRARIGNLIEEPGIFPNMNGINNLKCKCYALGIYKKGYAEHLMETVGLKDAGKKKVKKYSLGMKQRLGIAMALVGGPDLLILDEPINGLDPIGIAEVRSFIRELCEARGKTILISSHILSEIALLADDIGIIDHGVLLEEESFAELEQKNSKYVHFTISDTAQAARILERRFREKDFTIQDDRNLLLYNLELPVGDMVTAFVENGLVVSEAHTCEESLEDYFKRVTGGEGIA